MIEKILGSVFVLAVMAMLFFAFFWPLVVNDDPSDQVLRTGSLVTFGVYIACVISRLLLRIQNKGSGH